MDYSVNELARHAGGDLLVPGQRRCMGIAWDSRTVGAGDVYVALPGARVDGHDFCGAALAAGAACLLVSRDPGGDVRDAACAAGAGIVRVSDTFAAITDLARAWRGELSGKVLAVTGSSGKTTTKNLVRAVLSAAGTTVATEGNQNNELGVPATLLRADRTTAFVVVEMGMRGLHQLDALCAFVKPHAALVTNVGESHIELLGSRDGIAHAKAEALAAVPAAGFAFVNASDDFVRELVAYGEVAAHGARLYPFDGSGADPASYPEDLRPLVYASDITFDEEGAPSFVLHTPAGQAACRMRLAGAHNVQNACAAAAVGSAWGVPLEAIVSALEGARPVAGRQRAVAGLRSSTVIDDCYNANPDSLRASLATFATMKVAGKRIAVLGDMGELGSFSEEAHTQAGAWAAAAGVDELVAVGQFAPFVAAAAIEAGIESAHVRTVADASAALAAVEPLVGPGDCVLVKGSHSVGLEAVVKGLVPTHA